MDNCLFSYCILHITLFQCSTSQKCHANCFPARSLLPFSLSIHLSHLLSLDALSLPVVRLVSPSFVSSMDRRIYSVRLRTICFVYPNMQLACFGNVIAVFGWFKIFVTIIAVQFWISVCTLIFIWVILPLQFISTYCTCGTCMPFIHKTPILSVNIIVSLGKVSRYHL